MEKVTLFIMASCPHCRRALAMQEQLLQSDARYRMVPFEMIDETRKPDLAAQYDYYYVPTYYVGGRKLHEGIAKPADIKAVFDAALEG